MCDCLRYRQSLQVNTRCPRKPAYPALSLFMLSKRYSCSPLMGVELIRVFPNAYFRCSLGACKQRQQINPTARSRTLLWMPLHPPIGRSRWHTQPNTLSLRLNVSDIQKDTFVHFVDDDYDFDAIGEVLWDKCSVHPLTGKPHITPITLGLCNPWVCCSAR